MKKGIITLLIIMLASLMMPFNVYADIQGFDYTNYYELEYLQSDGSAYINTGYSPTRNTIYEGKVGSLGQDEAVYGTSGSGYYQSLVGMGNSMGKPGIQQITSTYKQPDLGNEFLFNFSFYISQSSITLTETTSGTVYTVSPSSGGSSPNNNLYVFAYHSGSSVTKLGDTTKIYWLKISNSNGVQYYYVPAERKSDGVKGFYDVQNSTFVVNANNTGSFSGPRLVTNYTVSTSVDPSAAGSVTGGGTYASGSVVTLTATANNGYDFDHWSDNNTDNPRTITVNSNLSYVAYFEESGTPGVTYTVTTNVSPSGAGSVSGGGTYNDGSTVTLTATANNGYIFQRWNDGSTVNPRTITVSSNVTYDAIFISYDPGSQYVITTNVSPSASGTVTGGGTYDIGDIATLTATPSAGYVFGSWSDGITINPRNIEVRNNFNVTAYFIPESQINNVMIGVNLNIISNSNYTYESHSYTGEITPLQSGYAISFSVVGDQYSRMYGIYEIEGVLNDTYMGYVNVGLDYYDGSSWNHITKTVYLNGNSFKVNQYVSNGGSIQLNSITVDTSHLYKSQSVESILNQGTNESNEAVDDTDDARNDFIDNRDDLISIENTASDNLDDALNDINVPANGLSGFGSSFTNSAIWVRTQFDRLTENNPFGSMIQYSLILGLALLFLGKVML